ncbi:uncharacterized protein CCOS01_01406 [Colletotrichum costaricense]|uniref:Uncharacterized protein n=1 Tax=Colletotrichum costaricense TaxID=1209916 RepID=A0AAJ0E719_9PEZI|nr:uncharacterized protein CCOS01_01406 [Colletotrichum costaricense]KAK1540092.1 hypothetical protein CCOS01_01406 [Colletotrichum costaricense]
MRINNRDRQTHTADGLPRQGWTWTWRGVTTRTTLSVSVSLSICYHPLFLSLSFFCFPHSPLCAAGHALCLPLTQSICWAGPGALWARLFRRRGSPSDWTSGQ